jgi:hypothetical protein
MNPRARIDNLVTEEVWDELVVFDEAGQEAHRLNRTAAIVWRNADGTRSVDELSELVAGQLGVPAERDLVTLALQDLKAASLLEIGAGIGELEGMSRREMLGRLKVAAFLLPVVATMAVPTALQAQASTENGGNPSNPSNPSSAVQDGTYGPGTFALQGGNCGFWGSTFRGTFRFSNNGTRCEVVESVTRVSNGSCSGNTCTYTGSGTIAGRSCSWVTTANFFSNSTCNVREVLTFAGETCSATYQSQTCPKQ